MSQPTFRDQIVQRIRAGYQILMVRSYEEARVVSELRQAVKQVAGMSKSLVLWDQINGFEPDEKARREKSPGDKNPVTALQRVADEGFMPEYKDALFVFHDLHNFFSNPDVRRVIRSLSGNTQLNIKDHRRPIVIVQPSDKLDPDIEANVTVVDFDLPDHAQLCEVIDVFVSQLRDKGREPGLEPEARYALARALSGLSTIEAENVLSLCLVRHGGFKPEVVDTVEAEKALTLRKTEVLNYVPREHLPSLESLGGYDELIAFVQRRALAYTAEAESVNLDNPKGLILAGVPGTGKSVAGMAVARALNLPLLEFDFANVFSALVGSSEARMRQVIQRAAAMNGCVLMIDEADKSLSGSLEGSGDSGVTRRVFGMLLTWLARKTDRTFVVMTLNRTEGLPPELLRKGRFDQMFFVDLPTDTEREAILKIHMAKRHVPAGVYSASDWKEFVRASNELVGAELEEALKSARFEAYQLSKVRTLMDTLKAAAGADKERLKAELAKYPSAVHSAAVDLPADQLETIKRAIPTAGQILSALASVSVTRVAVIDKESIDEIRRWGTDRAQPVSRELAEKSRGSAVPKRRRNVDS